MTATALSTLPPPVAAALLRLRVLYQRHGARLPPIVTLLLAALIAWQLASLIWLWVPVPESARWKPAPAPLELTPPKPAAANDALATAHLFGEYRAGAGDAASLANAPDTQLNFTLLGILAGSSDEESMALIAREGGDEAPYRIGADVSPGVALQAIFSDRVILARGGRLETLRLDKDAPSNAAVFTATSAGENQEGTPAAAEMLSQIRQQVMTDPSKAASFIRVQPIAGEGGVRGYRVYPGPERAAFNAAGLKPGDVVTAINGAPLSDPGQALQLLQSLSSASTVNLAVERNGAVQSVNLSLTQ